MPCPGREDEDMEPVILERFKIDIDRIEMARLLGSSKGVMARHGARVRREVDEAVLAALDLIEPKGIYKVTAGRDLPGSTIFERLEKVAFCVCTIGEKLERMVTQLADSGELVKAVVLDSAGSVAAEAVAGYMDDRIKEEAAGEGLKTSCRASPGYGNWDIGEQRAIFELLPAERIGVSLSESGMMIPRKSVSFAIDISKNPARLRSENSCRNCDIESCRYRTD